MVLHFSYRYKIFKANFIKPKTYASFYKTQMFKGSANM